MGYPKETCAGMKIQFSSTTRIIMADQCVVGKYTSGLDPNLGYEKQP